MNDSPTATTSSSASKTNIAILNQLIDDERGIYRVQYGDKVGYITITVDVFDDDTMCRPYLLIPRLPPLPQQPWTQLQITRNYSDGTLEASPTNNPLRAIESTWHDQYVNVLDAKRAVSYKSGVHEVNYRGQPAIAKISTFEWTIPMIETETCVYSLLDEYQREHPDESQISPRFLGHLTENGRVMGLLLEKLDGEHASIQDLDACITTLRQFHKLGLLHGDANRYNFLVDRSTGQVKMVDFEHAEPLTDIGAELELESLTSQLREDTGRGAPRIWPERS